MKREDEDGDRWRRASETLTQFHDGQIHTLETKRNGTQQVSSDNTHTVDSRPQENMNPAIRDVFVKIPHPKGKLE